MPPLYYHRRDTPLALKIKKTILQNGCMDVSQYMRMCLYDREYGYYVRQPVLGTYGDFTTAPEMSQMFGELIGVWCSIVWEQMNTPDCINLVELGPGRGMLMLDVLRASKINPRFQNSLSVHLVELNSTLAQIQKTTLQDCGFPLRWHASLETIPPGPTLLLANEFLDACPVKQQILYEDLCLERCVGVDNQDRLVFLVQEYDGSLDPRFSGDSITCVQETQNHSGLLNQLKARAMNHPLSALFIDYGYEKTALGETLQAIRSHHSEHPLCSPGEADLSVHVDFFSFSSQARTSGFAVDGPMSQGEFLTGLGIIERASRLMNANPLEANRIETDVLRLISENGMGTNFKVVGLRSEELPVLVGLSRRPF